MLDEMSSKEVSEWGAYFKLKAKNQEKSKSAQAAKQRAKKNNF